MERWWLKESMMIPSTETSTYSRATVAKKWVIPSVALFLTLTPISIIILVSPQHGVELSFPDKLQNSSTDTQRYASSYTNSTLCVYMKEYHLLHGKRATVCIYQERVRLDIRQFINGSPTIKGIFLYYDEFQSLGQYWPHIKRDMQDAHDLVKPDIMK